MDFNIIRNSESCVTSNGYIHPPFKLPRGIRQGCLIITLPSLLISEIVSLVLRTSDKIDSIKLMVKV